MLVIDTCSLINIARFYLPFDEDGVLFNAIETRVKSGEFIIIDKVYRQCSYTAKGFAINAFPFLKDNQTATIDCLPSMEFFRLLNNDFRSKEGKKTSAEEFEVIKNNFLEDADVKMLLYCDKNRGALIPPRILTDETAVNNDSKCFQKLPLLCNMMNIGVIDAPTFLTEFDSVNVFIKSGH